MKDYPTWVCVNCGLRYGRSVPKWATWHTDECDICGAITGCTEPRDFGHLKDGWDKNAEDKSRRA